MIKFLPNVCRKSSPGLFWAVWYIPSLIHVTSPWQMDLHLLSAKSKEIYLETQYPEKNNQLYFLWTLFNEGETREKNTWTRTNSQTCHKPAMRHLLPSCNINFLICERRHLDYIMFMTSLYSKCCNLSNWLHSSFIIYFQCS